MATFEFQLQSCDIDGSKILTKHGLEKGGFVQQVIDSECLRLMDPFVPFDTGALRDNGVMHTTIGNDVVVDKDTNKIMVPLSQDDTLKFKENVGVLVQVRWLLEGEIASATDVAKIPVKEILMNREVYSTDCPHRSVELHGGEAACKQYFINRIKQLMNPIGLGDACLKPQKDTLDIGFNFRLENSTEGRFRWLLCDINKKVWSEINHWTASNWITLAVNEGQYLVQCQLYDLNSKHIETKTIGTNRQSATEITGTYSGWKDKDTILIGTNCNNEDVNYVLKLYNTKTQKWFKQFENQWATFKPEKGTAYIMQAEVYNKSDKRLLASKARGFQA